MCLWCVCACMHAGLLGHAMILVFWMFTFKPTFSLSSFTFIKRLFSSSSLSAIRVVNLHIWGYWYFSRQSFSCSVVSNSLRPNELQHARLPCHYQIPELTQIHVHGLSDAIQPSPPPSSPSPPAINLSQHQGLFKWVSPSHQVTEVLEFQLQYQSFQWIFRNDFL